MMMYILKKDTVLLSRMEFIVFLCVIRLSRSPP